MKTDKWLYFRDLTNVDSDDGSPGTNYNLATSAMIPANRLINMTPVNTTLLRLEFRAVRHSNTSGSRYQRSHAPHSDLVDLKITAGKHKEVMQSITSAINSPSRNPFIIIADDVITFVDESTRATGEYIDFNLDQNAAVNNINLYQTPQGYGMHEYYEVVSPMTADDNDVAASLSVKLPAGCIVLEAGMTAITLAGNNVGLVALELDDGVIADDAASEGTEFLGADSTGGLTVPDADLDIGSSGGVLYDAIHSATTVPVDIATLFSSTTDEAHIHITAKEDMSTMTGAPTVGVYIKWFGGPAVALAW